MYAIETYKLTKKYLPPKGLKALLAKSPIKSEVTAVEAVDLQIRRGELFGLIGPNGAGKTTLVKMLCTLLWPTSGSALVNGYDIREEEQKVKASIGFVSGEERSFYWRLTGRQNLEFWAILHNMKRQTARKQIEKVLEQVGLSQVADNMFYSYSAGMKQKLAVARGLLTDPAVLFLDEPTKSVDAVTARELKQFLKEFLVKREGRTIFLTSHRLEEVEELCSRVAVMDQGRLIFCGTPAELRKSTAVFDCYTVAIRGLSSEDLQRVGSLAGLSIRTVTYDQDGTVKMEFSCPNGENPLPCLTRHIVELGGQVLACYKQEPNFESVFIELLQRSSHETR
jgi:ABC-2 type transport system ATP-binding protein